MTQRGYSKNGIRWLASGDSLKHHLGISPAESLRRGQCALCERCCYLVRHHLRPVSIVFAEQLEAAYLEGGGKAARRMSDQLRGCAESGDVADMCLTCHDAAHLLISCGEMCSTFNTVPALREHPGLAAYLAGLKG